MSHHRLFRYVQHYNQKMIWNNTVFLLTIIIMPFSTAVYSEYFNATLHTPVILYTINICCCGLYSYRLWHIIGNPKYRLSSHLDKVILRYKQRARPADSGIICSCVSAHLYQHLDRVYFAAFFTTYQQADKKTL